MNNKKLLSLSVAAISGLLTPLFAGNFFNTYGYSNFTPGGKFKITDPSGNAVGTAYTTPSFSFRFKSNNNIEPILRASPPTIQAGCNGLNIKGMFISIINLERLSEMLKNSGASLAWGVLVGLIYSLPGVAAAFRSLNQWAKAIQKLMQNACRSGIAIGQALAHAGKFDNHKGEDFGKFKSPQEVAKASDNPLFKSKSLLGLKGLSFDSDSMALSFDEDSDVTPSEALNDWFNALLNAYYIPTYNAFALSSILGRMDASSRQHIFNQIITTSGGATTPANIFSVGLMCVSFDDAFSDSECKSDQLSSSDVNVYVLNSSNGDFTNSFSTDDQKYNALMELWKLGVTSNFGADIAVTPESVFKTQKRISESYNANMGLGNISDDDKKKADKFLKQIQDGKIGAIETILTTDPYGPTKMKKLAENLTSLMYLGTGDSNTTNGIKIDDTLIAKMKAPLFTIVGMENPEDSGEKLYYIIFSGPSKGNAPFLSIDDLKTDFAKGAYQRSYDLIENMIKNGISSSLNGSMNIFLVVPGITYKISLLQKIPESRRKKYIDMLAQYNAYYATSAFIDNVFNGGTGFSTYTPIYYSDGDSPVASPLKKYSGLSPAKKIFSDILTASRTINVYSLNNAKKAGEEKLKKLVGNNIISSEKIDEEFRKLEKEIREQALKKVAQ